MDNITHSLCGAALAKTGFDRQSRRVAFWLLVISANVPDLDIVFQSGTRMTYLEQHRGLSHSLVLAPVAAFILAFLFRQISSVKHFRLLFLMSLTGILSHIVLDLVTSFGTQIFLPFTNHRYAWDLVFIIDIFLASLFGGTIVAARLAREQSVRVARWGVLVVAAYLLSIVVLKHFAGLRISAEAEQLISDVKAVSLLPQPPNAFHWKGIVETEKAYWQTFVTVGRKGAFEWTQYEFVLDNAYIQRAEESEQVKFYRWFSRFPVALYQHEGDRHVVEYRDLQFTINPTFLSVIGMGRSLPFVMRIEMDEEGRILSSDIR